MRLAIDPNQEQFGTCKPVPITSKNKRKEIAIPAALVAIKIKYSDTKDDAQSATLLPRRQRENKARDIWQHHSLWEFRSSIISIMGIQNQLGRQREKRAKAVNVMLRSMVF